MAAKRTAPKPAAVKRAAAKPSPAKRPATKRPAVKRALRAVDKDEKAPPPTPAPKTITEAASTGTHRELLVAMRDRIAKAVEDPRCPPRDLASLSRRLHELSKDIEQHDAIEAQEVARSGDVADEKFAPEAI